MGRKKGRGPRKIKQVWRRKEAPPPPWTELPRDITANILHRLGAVEILESAQKVCKTWRSVCKDPAMWRVIDMPNLDDMHRFDIMCQHAVDRSQGQLIDINIEYFGTDKLLEYIAQRSGQLRRLRLACCYSISGEGLCEAAKRLEFLEELHLFRISIPSESIKEIGCSCPLLKSFTFNDCGSRSGLYIEDEEAFAVAKSMPELRHLSLFRNKMTNEGLQGILDGCPHLESLDLRQCSNVNLGGDLGQRCSQQIKDLRRPSDSTSDYEFDDELYDEFDDYPSRFYDLGLTSDIDEYYLDYDDFTRLGNDDSDYEDDSDTNDKNHFGASQF